MRRLPIRLLLWLTLSLAAARATAQQPSPPAAEPAAESLSLEKLLDTVVTATLREQAAIDAPASITVVDAQLIRARGYRTLKQIMNDVPGFNDVADRNEEIVAVRGVFTSTTNKILILVNGHRMNDLMLGRYNTDQYLGLSAVEQVEFIRGPGSALYGTGALVGVVNVITRKGAELDGVEASGRLGPYARQASVDWGRMLAGYDLHFNFSYLDSPGQKLEQPAGLDVPPKGQPRLPGRIYLGRYRENLSALLTARGDQSALTLRAAHFRRTPPRGAHGGFFDLAAEPFEPAYTENDFFVDHSASFALDAAGKTRLTVNPSVHFFSYYEQSFIGLGANRLPPLGERSGMQGEFHNYQLKLTLQRPLLDGLDVTAGLDGLLASFYRSDAVTIRGDQVVLTPEGYTSTGRWFLGGVFVQAVWDAAPGVSITAGARYDTFQDEAAPELTPRAGVVWRPLESLAVKALYGRSYLAPMWAHKRARDGTFVGTPDLAPETFEGLDLILIYAGARVAATLDAFYNRTRGLINGVPQPGDQLSYQNSAHSVYLGAELSAEAQIERRLRLQGSYAHIRPDRDPGRTTPALLVRGSIADISHHTFRYGLRLDPLPSLSLSVWGRAYAATRTVDGITGVDTIPATAVLDATLGYHWRMLTLQLIGTNLTNRYYERGGTVPRPLARERLNVEAAVTARF